MVWEEAGEAGPDAPSRPHGRHRFAGPDAAPRDRDAFRLPPRIERMLDAWHARAHQVAAPADAPAA